MDFGDDEANTHRINASVSARATKNDGNRPYGCFVYMTFLSNFRSVSQLAVLVVLQIIKGHVDRSI